MKHFFRTLLGLVLMVLIFSGCEDPSRLEVPEGAKVEFVWGTSSQVGHQFENNLFMKKIVRYILGLESDQNGNYYYSYPKGYDKDKYNELCNNEEYLKKFYEDGFEEVFGTKYYKEGTIINLEEWTRPAKDLTTGNDIPGYSQLYFLAEDVGVTNDTKSLETIEVYNEDIKVYVYWKYTR